MGNLAGTARSRLVRIVLTAAVAACTGAVALVAVYTTHPGFTLEMDRPMPGNLSGFYPEERAGQETFAWTRQEATLRLPGLDRRGEWTCTVRLRGGRPDPATLPEVVFSVDGIIATRQQTTNDFLDITVPLAARDRSGAVITLTTPTFVPSPDDPRELGVFVDRWKCAPEGGFVPMPPRPALRTAAIATAAFGSVLAVIGAPVLVAGPGIAAIAGLQALPIGKDAGPFSVFAMPPEWLALALAVVLWASLGISRRALGRAVSSAGQFALCVTFVALYLKLLVQLHPSKLIVDAVFHAHRLQWILEGRYFFTQPMPSGVRFPYAIGLYVFAAPWTVFTTDFVTLLRVIVSSAEAAGAILLYHTIARYWGDRSVAAASTVLYALVPRTFEIVGNANLTNAFGQSAALAVLVAATLWPLSRGHWRTWIGLTLLIAAALLCHISTFTLLCAILGVLSALYWWFGRPSLRSEAWMIATATVAAAVLAIVVYYGHFGDAYRSAARVRAAPVASAGATAAVPSVPLSTRASDAASFAVQAVGWPILLLAIPGFAVWIRRGWRDRLGLAIAALGITFVLLTLSVVLAPVDPSFHRYALEFISRVTLATYPAMVVWAALGTVWTWRTGGMLRLGGAALTVAAFAVAGQFWLGWIQ